ncbi:MAG: redoxin domain-containing protein [Parachlamydiales bacterium]|nr:redoxin domain-containing protein [Parachlamydiales bacterium]
MGCLIGKKAPDFSVQGIVRGTIREKITLDDFQEKYLILFFYPLDFTFVCPTELHAFEQKYEEFQKRKAEVVACSIDSPYSHYAWLHTPKSKGGIEGIRYPILSDMTKEISRNYGILKEEDGVAYRALFLLDHHRVIRHLVVNDLSLGRSVDEALRMLDALICFEQYGEVCPADWHQGDKTMSPTQEGLENFFSQP